MYWAHGGYRMSAGEQKPDVNQAAKPALQATQTGAVAKVTSQMAPQFQSWGGSGAVKAKGGAGAILLPAFPHNVAAQATKGRVSSVDGGGLVLAHVSVYLVYWGAVWAQNPTPLADDITNSIKNIMSGPYISALAQYRNIGSGTFSGT